MDADARTRKTLKLILFILPFAAFAQQHTTVSPADRKRCDATKAQFREIARRTVELGKDSTKSCEGDDFHEEQACKDAVKRERDFLRDVQPRMKSLLANAPPGCNQEKLGLDPQIKPAKASSTPTQKKTHDEQEPLSDQQKLLEELDELEDVQIGMLRRELAVTRQLQNWYEVNPDHPDAVALAKELCANLKNKYPASEYIAAHREELLRLLDSGTETMRRKIADSNKLMNELASASRQLKGMGFSCP